MQGTGALFDLNKVDLVVDLHTEANFGEGCVPVVSSENLAVGRILLIMT